MTREELTQFVKEHAGSLLAGAVEQAVAKHLEHAAEGRRAVEDNVAMIQRLRQAARAEDLEQARADGLVAKTREPGLAMARFIRAQAAARFAMLKGEVKPPHAFLEAWGDKDLAKATEKAMSASIGAEGGYLVPPQFSQDVIELLRPASVLRFLGAVMLPMATGTMRIPKITGGVTAAYIGENAQIGTSQLVLGQLALTFKKLTALVPVSGDLVRYSSPGADALVRDDAVRSNAQRENQGFLRDDGMDGTPKGMRNWVVAANVTNSAGTTLANMVTDLSTAILGLVNNNIPEGRWAWILNPRSWMNLMMVQTTTGAFAFRDEMSRGTLMGYPFARTTTLPGSGATGEYYLANMADMVIGESQNFMVDTSLEASYVDAVTGLTVSAFQNDQMLIRTISEHDFVARRGEAISVIQAASY